GAQVIAAGAAEMVPGRATTPSAETNRPQEPSQGHNSPDGEKEPVIKMKLEEASVAPTPIEIDAGDLIEATVTEGLRGIGVSTEESFDLSSVRPNLILLQDQRPDISLGIE